MLYVIISEDVENSLPLRQKPGVRPAHLARFEELIKEGRLIIGGPNPAIDNPDPGEAGFTGSVAIVEFDSLEEAEKFANDDPYVHAGVYKSVTVKPFKKVLP